MDDPRALLIAIGSAPTVCRYRFFVQSLPDSTSSKEPCPKQTLIELRKPEMGKTQTPIKHLAYSNLTWGMMLPIGIHLKKCEQLLFTANGVYMNRN